MAGASTNVYKCDNVAVGQHINKSNWTPLTGKTCFMNGKTFKAALYDYLH